MDDVTIESEPKNPQIVDKRGSLCEKPSKPLTRKLDIPAKILIPYRLLVFVRVIVLGVFLERRIRNPNHDARWLWLMSVTCEIWFAFSWLLDQLPKLFPVNRETDLNALREVSSNLPKIDVFVSTTDPEKEPPLITANTILSILATDYPVENLFCYVSDDGGSLLTFEAVAEAASFAYLWVPFCRKHNIEPRNPEAYFSQKRIINPLTKSEFGADFVKDRRKVKREYDEFKVRINSFPDSIRRRSDVYNAAEEIRGLMLRSQTTEDYKSSEASEVARATWMTDGTHWPGTWSVPAPKHSRSDHTGIIQVMLKPPSDEPLHEDGPLDFTKIDVRLPMLVYLSREKRPGYNHNKKAGAMNALLRASAIMSNGPFVLNLDCDHYIYNSQAIREGMCFMLDRGGDRVCYVQFPQRFEGIDPCDRYANRNTIFFDVNMRALDGLQGPIYVGTGCLFRRTALYGFNPPEPKDRPRWSTCCCCFPNTKIHDASYFTPDEDHIAVHTDDSDNDETNRSLLSKRFGSSSFLINSISVPEFQGRAVALTIPKGTSNMSTLSEAISVISCWYEEKTDWGKRVGWIYGSVTEDVVTGYRMHDQGWESVYCLTEPDAFRGTAPINLTDRLNQVLRWATGSVEIFFSRNNALLASSNMSLLQRVAYLNVGIYPFTSVFLVVYCFLPALSLFSGRFVIQFLDFTFITCLLVLIVTICTLALLEAQWAGIGLDEWWRNEQFWLIGGTSAHLSAVLHGLSKAIAGIEIPFALTSKPMKGDDEEFADLYDVKWTYLMIPPITIIITNIIAIVIGVSRAIYSTTNPQWARLLGGVVFSFWVLAHFYPFVKGLTGRRGEMPTIVFVWSCLIAIAITILWFALS